jgi:hypothetical protein
MEVNPNRIGSKALTEYTPTNPSNDLGIMENELSTKLKRKVVVKELTPEDLEELEQLHISYRMEQEKINEQIRAGTLKMEPEKITIIWEEPPPTLPQPEHEFVEGF